MEIQYYTKHVYGKPLRFIVEETYKKAVLRLNNQKTLNDNTMSGLGMLGFTFTEVLAPKA
jgi:hypothetical protein